MKNELFSFLTGRFFICLVRVGDEYSAVLSSLKVLSWIMIAVNADREHLLSHHESTNLCVNLKLIYNTGSALNVHNNIYFSY